MTLAERIAAAQGRREHNRSVNIEAHAEWHRLTAGTVLERPCTQPELVSPFVRLALRGELRAKEL